MRNKGTVIAGALAILVVLAAIAVYLALRPPDTTITKNKVHLSGSSPLVGCFLTFCLTVSDIREIRAVTKAPDTRQVALNLLRQHCREDLCGIGVTSHDSKSQTALLAVHKRFVGQLSRPLFQTQGDYLVAETSLLIKSTTHP